MPCQLSAYQKALCKLAEGEVQPEEACKESQALRRMNNTLMELRTICNHPLIRHTLLLLYNELLLYADYAAMLACHTALLFDRICSADASTRISVFMCRADNPSVASTDACFGSKLKHDAVCTFIVSVHTGPLQPLARLVCLPKVTAAFFFTVYSVSAVGCTQMGLKR